MISPAEAEAAIRRQVQLLPETTMPLEALTGAVLREAILASRDQPAFERVTIDCVAFATAAFEQGRRTFRIAGTQAAGAAPLTLSDRDACLEVMTGASMPVGCDCVIPVEKLSVHEGVVQLGEDAAPARGLNIHTRGLDARRGDSLLDVGARLGPAEVAVIASIGRTHARVTRAPDIVVISTGDELIEPGEPLEDWQIYRSNAYGVLTALQRRGYSQLTQDHVPDDLPTLRTRLREHLDDHDVLILSGGVSMGRFDYVPQVLEELGISLVFHRVSQRPGKPMWFGVGAGGKTVYALPGNPVSTLVCLTRYVFPGLDAALGAATSNEAVALAESFEVKAALTFFLPVKLAHDEGHRSAAPRPTRGSGDFTSLIGTDGFVELPPGPQVVPRGASVPFYRW
ncbi:MAG: molybdopterin molybdotransferase MoeA [Steroidobacter sp.]